MFIKEISCATSIVGDIDLPTVNTISGTYESPTMSGCTSSTCDSCGCTQACTQSGC